MPSRDIVAEALVDADVEGLASHGMMLLPMYLDRITAGSVAPKMQGRVISDTGAQIVIDADNGLGQIVAEKAVAMAVERARKHGLAAVAVRNAFHFGAAGRFAQIHRAARLCRHRHGEYTAAASGARRRRARGRQQSDRDCGADRGLSRSCSIWRSAPERWEKSVSPKARARPFHPAGLRPARAFRRWTPARPSRECCCRPPARRVLGWPR